MSDVILKVASSQSPQIYGAKLIMGLAGPAGEDGADAAMITTSSFASPTLVTTAITPPTDQRGKLYVGGSGGPATPTLGNGTSDNQELFLYGTHDTNTVTLVDASNLLLAGGEWIGKANSILSLIWCSTRSKWTEVSRNEY